jgi:hypothetical protein
LQKAPQRALIFYKYQRIWVEPRGFWPRPSFKKAFLNLGRGVFVLLIFYKRRFKMKNFTVFHPGAEDEIRLFQLLAKALGSCPNCRMIAGRVEVWLSEKEAFDLRRRGFLLLEAE